MWTFVARQEIAVDFNTNRQDSPWFPIDPYVVGDESKSGWFSKIPKDTINWQNTRDDLHNRYKINKSLGLVEFAKEYYKITGRLHDTYSSLKEVLMLQDFLESRNVKYMFTYVSEHVMHGLYNYESKYAKGLYNFIKFDEWYKFPGPTKFTGFNDWARANGYPYATSHPLEQAHRDAAEMLYEKVRQIIATKPSAGSMGPLSGE